MYTRNLENTKKMNNISKSPCDVISHDSSHKSNDSASMSSLATLMSSDYEQGRKKDSVPFRIKFIQELLRDKTLRPLIDFNREDTDYFKCGTECDDTDCDGEYDYSDTRNTLHKKVDDFYNVITQIGGKLHYIKSGTTGHTFRGEIQCDPNDENSIFEYAVKVVAYPKKSKYGEIYEAI